MTSALAGLPPHLQQRLETALETGLLSSPCSLTALRSVLGLQGGGEELKASLDELANNGITDKGTAAWLRALRQATARQSKPDLVWSGPEVTGLHARDTRRVYQELLGTAEQSIWASTYVYTDGPRAFQTLANRIDKHPRLQATLLLNIQRQQGDTTTPDQLVRAFADRFWTTDWPGTTRPNVYYDPRSLETKGPGGVLHAKVVIADNEAVFITSANITDAALDRNIELGLLTKDRTLAATIATHFQTLIDQQHLKPLPPA